MRNQITPEQREKGLRYILYDGMMSQAMVSLSAGAFIIAFALLLGASIVSRRLYDRFCPTFGSI